MSSTSAEPADVNESTTSRYAGAGAGAGAEKEQEQLQQKVVVVTGCSSGIGLHVALQLSERRQQQQQQQRNNDSDVSNASNDGSNGVNAENVTNNTTDSTNTTNLTFKVIATIRRMAASSSAVSTLRAAGCDVQPLDVTNEDSLQQVTTYIAKTYGCCDILVNNAGYGIAGSLEAVSVTDAKRVFDVNVWGVMRLCQLIVPLMRQGGTAASAGIGTTSSLPSSSVPVNNTGGRKPKGGLILTVSSMAGVIGQPFSDVYTASKHAVEGLMESFRFAVEADNIKVVVVNPGPTATEFGNRIVSETAVQCQRIPKQTETETGTETKTEGVELASYHRVATTWAKVMHHRNATGQPVRECAAEIAAVIERDMDRYIVDGRDFAPFRNPTAQQGRVWMDDVLKRPDACTGVYTERFEVARGVIQRDREQP